MYQMIQDFPRQFARGFEWSQIVKIETPIERVIVSGMGGSSLPTDLVNSAFSSQLPRPLITSRDYQISEKLTPNDLVIAISFSGNTAETIHSFKQAIAAGAQVVAVASGGELLELAIKSGVPYVRLIKDSPNFQPRMASGYLFSVITSLLVKANWLPLSAEREVLESLANVDIAALEIQGRQLGESLIDTIPIFYASPRFWPVARIGKIKFNENSKIPAFWNVFPELNHNEMVGFSNTRDNYRIVMLRDRDDEPVVNRHMDITAKVLRSQGIGLKATIWDMPSGEYLTKMFTTLIVLDWASYYLALAMKVDPTPVQLVEDFKGWMKEEPAE